MGKNSYECVDEKIDSNNSEMDDDNDRAGDASDSNVKVGHAARSIGTLDDGTTAFMQWLESVNKQYEPNYSMDMPVILRKFIKDKRTILYDKNLESEIDVEIIEGVPICRYCNLDDCLHVGFTISLEQMCEDRVSNQELSVDEIFNN